MQFRGAMATPFNGVTALAAAVLKEITGQDRLLELGVAASSVEWAAALSATIFPVEPKNYSAQTATEFCASLYSGVNREAAARSPGDVETVVEGLLALDNDAPILKVEEAFSGNDVDRLNKVVYRLSGADVTPDGLRKAIAEINDRVKAYDSRSERQMRVNLVALLGALGTAASLVLNPPEVKLLPLGAWLVNYLFRDAEPESAVGKTLVDWARGLNAWTTGDVVLVSRVRRNLDS